MDLNAALNNIAYKPTVYLKFGSNLLQLYLNVSEHTLLTYTFSE